MPAGQRLKDPKTSFLNNVYFGRKTLEMRASKHGVNKQQTSRFGVIILIYDKSRLQNTDIVERIVRKPIANQNLTGNVLKTILKIDNVKEQIYMEISPKFCNTK